VPFSSVHFAPNILHDDGQIFQRIVRTVKIEEAARRSNVSHKMSDFRLTIFDPNGRSLPSKCADALREVE
jgi:hypothetical protein